MLRDQCVCPRRVCRVLEAEVNAGLDAMVARLEDVPGYASESHNSWAVVRMLNLGNW